MSLISRLKKLRRNTKKQGLVDKNKKIYFKKSFKNSKRSGEVGGRGGKEGFAPAH